MTGGSGGNGHAAPSAGGRRGAPTGGALDLERLVDWLAEGHVRYLRLRVGGTEVVYARDGTEAASPCDGTVARDGAGGGALSGAPPAPSPTKTDGDTGLVAGRLGAAAPGGRADVDVVAPMAGIFHHAPAPGAPPYVVAGQQVADATTVGLMESMKIFTAVAAGLAGTVVSVLVPNGQPVEKGQPLVRLRPDVAVAAGAGT